MRRRGALVWVGLFVVAVVVGFIARPGRSDGAALDPTSTAPDGTRALSELLGRYADDVATADFDDSTDTVIVLEDVRDSTVDEALEAWVRRGGSLIWLDNRSTFAPLRPAASSVVSAEGESIDLGECSIAAIVDLSTLTAPGMRLYATDEASAVCFAGAPAGSVGGTAAIAQFRLERGRVTVLGAATLVDNEHLAQADNAALIVRLATADGNRRVALVHPSTITMGPALDSGSGLFDLIPARVNVFLAQLVVATGIWLWYRGRRFGKVVDEAQLVEIPASLLVRSAAELQRRAKGDEWASATLRSDFAARLRQEHRLGSDTSAEVVVSTVAQRTGYPIESLVPILGDDRGLSLAELLTAIDQATPHVFSQAPVSAAAPIRPSPSSGSS